MARNIILLVSSAAILLLAFGGYVLLVGQPTATAPRDESVLPSAPLLEENAVTISNVEIPAGGAVDFTVYDEHTNRPKGRFRCERWTPQPGSDNRFAAIGPELTMRLPNGMEAIIRASEGEVTVDRSARVEMTPKRGTLRGDAQIIVDRYRGPDRPPRAERPDDLVTIGMDDFSFDVELGELSTDGPIRVESPGEFELHGRGLRLIWNEAENRVELLTINEGRQLVFYARNGLLGETRDGDEAASEGDAPNAPTAPRAAEPLAAAPDERPSDRIPRRTPTPVEPDRSATYACQLSDNVCVRQLRGDIVLASLAADELRLIVDLGARAKKLGNNARKPTASKPADSTSASPSPTTAATTSAPVEPPQRVEVAWSGPLRITPVTNDGRRDREASRRVEATGAPLRLASRDGTVVCRRLVFKDETQQIWLYGDGTPVEFSLQGELPPRQRAAREPPPRLTAHADSVYIDQRGGIIKLIGAVQLDAATDPTMSDSGRQPLQITCGLWGELHLVKREAPAAEADAPNGALRANQGLAGGTSLERARFVGDVKVLINRQALHCNALATIFKPGDESAQRGLDLDRAEATGDVRFVGRDDQSLTCGWLALTFDRTVDRKLFARDLEARGDVLLSARQGRTAARGERVHATLAPDNRVESARFVGSANRPAGVRSVPFVVRGKEIVLNPEDQLLAVDGPSRVSFRSQRGLRGASQSDRLVLVSASESLRINGKGNVITFGGAVRARTGDESLLADKLTVRLNDLPAAPVSQPILPDPLTLAKQAGARLLGLEAEQQAADDAFVPSLTDGATLDRKEPVFLVAENATLQSLAFVGDDPQPKVHQSIQAPRLEVAIPQRQIRTIGETTLGLTDRRVLLKQQPTADASATPRAGSALRARGPSESALQCTDQLIYQIGAEDETPRRDSVLMLGNVKLVHYAGRDVPDLDRLLPEVARQPELLDQLGQRSAYVECNKLEAFFMQAEQDRARPAGPALGGGSMEMSYLNATGDVFLRDQQGSRLREMVAGQVEFDAARDIIRVYGPEGGVARIYDMDPQTGQLDVPVVGPAFTIDLNTNTVRSDRIRGEMQR